MPKEYVTKPVAASPYRIDGRVAVGHQRQPELYSIQDGPTVNAVSGVRVDSDKWPSASGT